MADDRAPDVAPEPVPVDQPAEMPSEMPSEKPVGRRVVLGRLGLGAVGVLTGARVQDWLVRIAGSLIAKNGTGLVAWLPIGTTPSSILNR